MQNAQVDSTLSLWTILVSLLFYKHKYSPWIFYLKDTISTSIPISHKSSFSVVGGEGRLCLVPFHESILSLPTLSCLASQYRWRLPKAFVFLAFLELIKVHHPELVSNIEWCDNICYSTVLAVHLPALSLPQDHYVKSAVHDRVIENPLLTGEAAGCLSWPPD